MWRTLRAVLSSSRLPLRLHARLAQNATAYSAPVQRVRFIQPNRPYRRLTRIFLYGTTSALAVAIYPSLVSVFSDEDEEEDGEEREEEDDGQVEKQQSHVTRGQPSGAFGLNGLSSSQSFEDETFEESSEENIFIPLAPARQSERTFYKSSDPEWHAFVKFSQDKPKRQRAEQQLLQRVAEVTGAHPYLRQIMGNPVNVQQAFLEVEFPSGPPPEYEKAGLLITPSYIAWVAQIIPSDEYKRMKDILYPRTISYSFLAFFQVLWLSRFEGMMRTLGFRNQESDQSLAPLKLPDSHNQNEESPSGTRSNHRRISSQSGAAHPSMGSNTSDHNPSPHAAPNLGSLTSNKPGLPTNLPAPLPIGPVQKAMHEFRQTLFTKARPIHFDIPRGHVKFSGLVHLVGARATSTIDVVAPFNPRTSEWGVVELKVRSIRRRVQRPRG